MNPLSPLTYYLRHKRQTLLLMSLISLTTLGVCIMVRLLDSGLEQPETTDRYLTRFSTVSALGPSLEPGVVAQIRANPDVAHAILEEGLYVYVPMIGALPGSFRLFGASEADLPVLMDICDVRLREGRLPKPRTNEFLLSQELADTLGLQVGNKIGRSVDERRYEDILTPMVLVGILESDPSTTLRTGPSATLPSERLGTGRTDPAAGSAQNVLLGFVSYEYIDSHELYAPRSSSLVVVAHEGRKAAVDDFLETAIASPRTEVITYRQWTEFMAQAQQIFHLIFGVVDCLVAVVIALVVATINRIALAQRMTEFGLLHGIGHSRSRLTRRLTLETAVVAGMGWVGGLGLSWMVFVWLRANLYTASMELDLANLTPIWFSAPIPLAVIGSVARSTRRVLARLDAVAVIDRGQLSMEAGDRQRAVKRPSAKPLSPWTFYLRHRRRGLAMAVAMAMMILGVAFPVFLLSPMIDANRLFLEHLRRISHVRPRIGDSVDPAVAARIRTHPAVARVIPTVELWPMIEVPPVNRTTVRTYGVSEDDMRVLIDLYGVQLEEGRLPRPRSNEIVLSRAMAMNRGLRVGDKIGRPVYEYDLRIPTEMVVVGILSRPSRDPREGDLWTGFASYEYLRSHELYSSNPVSLLVVPTEGHKRELDGWLEENIASEQTAVRTYEAQLSEHRRTIQTMLLLFGVVEGVIALVAAVALAVLSYTFFAQRREEFGILHAMGHSRPWLVRRTAGETASIVAVAWLMSAAVCVAGLSYMQASLYAPKGLTLDVFNPAPWLFALPMPVTVIIVSAGLVAWMLSRLDPVAIIERR
jgi:ABC-type lipoprotein release transport system permease subunit